MQQQDVQAAVLTAAAAALANRLEIKLGEESKMQYAIDTLEKELLRLEGVEAQAQERLIGLREMAGDQAAAIEQEEERLALIGRRMLQLQTAIDTLQEQLHTIY